MPGVGKQAGWELRVFGAHVTQAFGHVPYQVGSSLTKPRGWRDVDVRLILPDEEFATYFGDPLQRGWAGGPVVATRGDVTQRHNDVGPRGCTRRPRTAAGYGRDRGRAEAGAPAVNVRPALSEKRACG